MKETISALMDGELDERSAAAALDTLARDAQALEAWRTYHVISDALGRTRLLSEGFAARVAADLAQEPTVLAPARVRRAEPRRWVAMAAGVAAVSLVAWLGFAPRETAVAPVVPLAVAPKSAPVQQASPARVPLPSEASDYLLAHQGFSPRVSLQGMAPYARTVSEQVRESRR
jgi:sigma-E factor negative regulatory protein RseA